MYFSKLTKFVTLEKYCNKKMTYCKINIFPGALIFVDFMLQLNQENWCQQKNIQQMYKYKETENFEIQVSTKVLFFLENQEISCPQKLNDFTLRHSI